MNRNLWLLALAQGLFLTNNVVFIGINGLVGLALAPVGWMATLPITGYVVGSALSTGLVAKSQQRWGRRVSFQLGLLAAIASALLCALATVWQTFYLLIAATMLAVTTAPTRSFIDLLRPSWLTAWPKKKPFHWS